MGTSTDSAQADALREDMINQLWTMGAVRSERIADVFRVVDRRWFTPETSLQQAYDPRAAVPIKRDEHGVAISTVSAPQLQAGMLEQADVRPDMSVLEIGSGGVNAAMLSYLAGPDGSVTSVDIDPEVTARARELLDRAGFPAVNVITADAAAGEIGDGPYDRIVVTVSAWDVPSAWTDQLGPRGRLVVPLRMRGLTRSLALDRQDDHLVSRSAEVCGFVTMQGQGATTEQLVPLRGSTVVVRFDDGWPDDQPPELDELVTTRRVELWSGVTLPGSESFDTLSLWLATRFTGFGRLAAEPDQKDTLASAEVLWFDPAVVTHDSVAYLTARRASPGVSEFGVYAFGPHADTLAEQMAEQIRVWDRERRHGPGPDIAVWPRETSDERLPPADLVITKRHSRITISWPAAEGAASQAE
ncbi:methyltransferase, FxLD system [Actinopolyspora erythraea]|uniref:Protein-L-isoaspartate O-methyltransferase n=1 Tax=Actinopolyspora erythraea TaxID=414996 RepID=A0A099D066_9ACTN|nr:methyltransferase, FxLD system [Actinopolyspora erythraea]ASU79794.1 methyltransferase, FxLD system [Actinopolyspora erythraea]KGI79583.1 protein-L-isoaspartate O-methyltransferase [Actinopolyspora erythraea]